MNWTADAVSDYHAKNGVLARWSVEVDFGLVDTKKRPLGCWLMVEERKGRFVEWSNTTVPGGFYVAVQACRNGKAFGASFPKFTGPHATLEVAQAVLAKKATQSKKRQLKQFPQEEVRS